MTVDISGKELHTLSDAKAYLELSAKELVPHLKGNVLELGCGNGNLTQFLAMEFPFTAVDIDDGLLADARRGLSEVSKARGRAPKTSEFLKWDLTKAPKPEWKNHFDTLLSCQVLEHLEDDKDILRRYLDCVKPGGRVVLQLPSHGFAYSPMDKSLGHFRRYDKASVQKLFESTGLKTISIYYYNFVGLLGWLWAGKIRRCEDIPKGELKLFNGLVKAALLPDVVMKHVAGLNVIGVAEKPYHT